MTSPNLILMLVEYAIPEAESLENEAADLEEKAAAKRLEASVLRQLHAIAEPHAPQRSKLEIA